MEPREGGKRSQTDPTTPAIVQPLFVSVQLYACVLAVYVPRASSKKTSCPCLGIPPSSVLTKQSSVQQLTRASQETLLTKPPLPSWVMLASSSSTVGWAGVVASCAVLRPGNMLLLPPAPVGPCMLALLEAPADGSGSRSCTRGCCGSCAWAAWRGWIAAIGAPRSRYCLPPTWTSRAFRLASASIR